MKVLTVRALHGWVTPEDGVLPDGDAEALTESDWQGLLDLVHARAWGLWWGKDSTSVPADVASLWSGSNVHSTLALGVGAGVQINVRPTRPGEDLDFDFDIREIRTQAQAAALSDFVRALGLLLHRPVRLLWEGSTTAFVEYKPDVDEFIAAR